MASLYNAPVTLTTETLISISSSIRQDLVQALSKKRVPVQMAQNTEVTIVEELDVDGVPINPIKPVMARSEEEVISPSDLNIKTTFTITTGIMEIYQRGQLFSMIQLHNIYKN